MLSLLVFAVVWAVCQAKAPHDIYSYSPAVGGGTGVSFSSSGQGRITALRIWENTNSYITGIQLSYDSIWTPILGRSTGNMEEIELFDGESIIQISGKYNQGNFIYRLMFVTNRGRSLSAGQPLQRSFNFYASNPEAELRMLSGRFNGNGITSLGAHWGTVYKEMAHVNNITS